jgi:hypothetical protein
MKDLHKTVSNQVRKSAMAYLEGNKNLNWILGIIKSTNIDKEELKRILENLENYGNKDRFNELFISCTDQELIEK